MSRMGMRVIVQVLVAMRMLVSFAVRMLMSVRMQMIMLVLVIMGVNMAVGLVPMPMLMLVFMVVLVPVVVLVFVVAVHRNSSAVDSKRYAARWCFWQAAVDVRTNAPFVGIHRAGISAGESPGLTRSSIQERTSSSAQVARCLASNRNRET